MKKDLGPLLARASVDEIETQHDAVGRLVKILAEARDPDDGVEDARTALYDLLTSPRLAVVSKACRGEHGRRPYPFANIAPFSVLSRQTFVIFFSGMVWSLTADSSEECTARGSHQHFPFSSHRRTLLALEPTACSRRQYS